MKTLLVLAAVCLLVIAGCAKATQQAQPPAQQGNVDQQIQGELVNVDNISQDLNFSDLDNLDQDLNFG
jgi:acid phosphatase class B